MRAFRWIWVIPLSILALGLTSFFVRFDRPETIKPVDLETTSPSEQNLLNSDFAERVENLKNLSLFETSIEVIPQNVRGLKPQPEISTLENVPFSYRFVGMTKTGSRHQLHFVHLDTNEKLMLMFGDIIEGWSLTKIDGKSAELTRGDARIRLDLFQTKPDP